MNRINFKPFPELKTNRFELRQFKKSDAEKIFEIRSNKEVAKYLDRPLAKTISDGLAFIEKINECIKRNELIYWGIFPKNNSEIIGTITLWQISEDETKAEIGFELLPKFQGTGVMKEVIAEVIKFAFVEMKLTIIEGEVDPKNIKSIKLMEMFGFVLELSLEKTNIYILEVG
ncbi:MAG: GNAT family N-acetyltransferase [Melioribacteraceae bacterium]|nr:GNAT family N-acetyltransferase [Melioribacteraceae bacterium]